LNIGTWTLELPEVAAGSTNRAAELEPALKKVAGVLKPLNADILILHGVPDRNVAKQLTGLLRPRVYQNPIYSQFRRGPQNPEIVDPPITVLSRKQPASSRSIEWRATGAIDSPGGFSFATFHYGTNTLFLYTVQFPKVLPGMTPQQEASVPRKRELGARYLVSHLNWLVETSTNAASFAYLASDLELDGAGATNEPALAVLKAGGFKASTGGRSLVASAALAATGWPPEGAMVSAFLRGAEFPGDPESISRKSFFAPVALLEVDLESPARPVASLAGAASGLTNAGAVAAVGGSGAKESSPGTARTRSVVSWADDQALMIGMAGAVVILGALAVYWRSRSRSALMALVPVSPRGGLGNAVAGELSSGSAPAGRMALPEQGSAGRFRVVERQESPGMGSADGGMGADFAEVASGGFGAGGGAGSGPGAGAGAGPGAGGPGKASQWPFLHLLRERLVRWLAAERSQLLSSHHAGAEQVLELEERLTRIQNQFESRLRAREQRIGELEAELMAKEKRIGDLEQHGPGRKLPT
jgi:hypothetical protein